ncbi:MAG: PD-(D/E)XK nuclease family protein [Verrucomicrobiota bacterium]
MNVRFLIGPAGSGKTQQCLEEIRQELRTAPEGRPLLLLAPKQSTFQLERQLLSDPHLPGYVRLQILSFERLAHYVVQEFNETPPRLLSEEGRLMVLRALLMREGARLKIFRAAARLPGFARQLSLLLRELQQHQISPARLLSLAGTPLERPQLNDKLHDLATLMHAYREWMAAHQLDDADELLDHAAKALERWWRGQSQNTVERRYVFDGVWLDGFAEMTPQELAVLEHVVRCSRRSTLAFCLEARPTEDISWLSTWSVIGQTFKRCHSRFAANEECQVSMVTLPRQEGRSRFSGCPELAFLEANWAAARPHPFGGNACIPLASDPPQPSAAQATESVASGSGPIRLVACANPEAEAVMAAREILKFVRAGGRYREVAVTVRHLEGYAQPLRRVFTRYQIPHFLDARESVAHHPLAELTRAALRMAAYDWKQPDWFAALKSGLVHVDESAIDALENEALARGWESETWFDVLPGLEQEPGLASVEKLRTQLTPPFIRFTRALPIASVTGEQLVNAVQELWADLKVSQTLETWAETRLNPRQDAVHGTVWSQMQEWLHNLSQAFAQDALPLRDWLPIVEAGLSTLTVGVIPPALDQVIIGAVDRSRSPELQLAMVLGMNETVFPAPPATPTLLNEEEREALARQQLFLGVNTRQRIGHERYYGYIACTRARRQLVLSWSLANDSGAQLNPSVFIAQVKALFPQVDVEKFDPSDARFDQWQVSEHQCELAARLLREPAVWPVFEQCQPLRNWVETLLPLRDYHPDEALSPAMAARLYGRVLRTSVSRIEQYGMCPFRYFAHSGMGTEERKQFELGVRETGTFQHEVLERFHLRLQAEGKKWRDLTPRQARELIGVIAGEVAQDFKGGLFGAGAKHQFAQAVFTQALQDFIEVVVGWMQQYAFDPMAVELEFGRGEGSLPAWELDLDEDRKLVFNGIIDRVDVCRTGDDEACVVVIDYKSSSRKPDPVLLQHGIQMQLPAYLSVLRHLPEAAGRLGVAKLIPAGVFYVSLRGEYGSAKSRADALADVASAHREAYQHAGRFNFEMLPKLDNRGAGQGDQFNYRLKQDGTLYKTSKDPMLPGQFTEFLDMVEDNLKRMGREIFTGKAAVSPYKKGGKTACEYCLFKTACRFDSWNQSFRELRASE